MGEVGRQVLLVISEGSTAMDGSAKKWA